MQTGLCTTRFPVDKNHRLLHKGSAVWTSYCSILVPVIKASCLPNPLRITAQDSHVSSATWAQFPGVVILKLELVVMFLHCLFHLKHRSNTMFWLVLKITFINTYQQYFICTNISCCLSNEDCKYFKLHFVHWVKGPVASKNDLI